MGGILLLISGCAGSPDGFNKSIYVSGGLGVSRLTPITEGTDFTIDDGYELATWQSVGVDLTERFSAELLRADLGTAKLQPGPADIDYEVKAALSGLWYGLGRYSVVANRSNGFAGYMRLGVSEMDYESDIPLDAESGAQVWVGFGGEYMFGNGLAARLELSSYDGDAQALQTGLLYRWGRSRHTGPINRPASRPAPTPESPAETTVETAPAAEPAAEPERQERPQVLPETETPTPTPTVAGPESVAPDNKILTAGIQHGIEFRPGTAVLTPLGGTTVRKLAVTLIDSPVTRIEIQTHTDSSAGPAAAMALTKQRVIAVARILIAEGVPKSRLAARAFGSNRPIASDSTAAGRGRNNRVELAL